VEETLSLLQVKEARASVLEAYAGKSVFSNRGLCREGMKT
jgi:hypothetical protein